jgi:hypothetical protein
MRRRNLTIILFVVITLFAQAAIHNVFFVYHSYEESDSLRFLSQALTQSDPSQDLSYAGILHLSSPLELLFKRLILEVNNLEHYLLISTSLSIIVASPFFWIASNLIVHHNRFSPANLISHSLLLLLFIIVYYRNLINTPAQSTASFFFLIFLIERRKSKFVFLVLSFLQHPLGFLTSFLCLFNLSRTNNKSIYMSQFRRFLFHRNLCVLLSLLVIPITYSYASQMVESGIYSSNSYELVSFSPLLIILLFSLPVLSPDLKKYLNAQSLFSIESIWFICVLLLPISYLISVEAYVRLFYCPSYLLVAYLCLCGPQGIHTSSTRPNIYG